MLVKSIKDSYRGKVDKSMVLFSTSAEMAHIILVFNKLVMLFPKNIGS